MEISHFIFTFQIRNEIASLIVFVWDCYAHKFTGRRLRPAIISQPQYKDIYLFCFRKTFSRKKIKKEPARGASALVVCRWLGRQAIQIGGKLSGVVGFWELGNAGKL